MFDTVKASTYRPLTGKMFLFGVPVMTNPKGQAFIYMYSFHEMDMMVNVTMRQNGSLTSDFANVSIEKSQVKMFKIDSKYNTRHSVGLDACLKLVADKEFGAYLFLYDTVDSVASLQLLPVNVWGTRYNVFTSRYTAFLQLYNYAEENTITIQMKKITNKVFLQLNNKEIYLKREEMFVFSDCPEANEDEEIIPNALDSKTIYYENRLSQIQVLKVYGSRPFGVISGGCQVQTSQWYCGLEYYQLEQSRDLTAEMFPPSDLYGKEFVVPVLEGQISPVDTAVCALYNNTEVFLFAEDTNYTRTELHEGYWAYLSKWNNLISVFIKSSKPILAVLLQRSACHTISDRNVLGELGDPAMSFLLPNNLFYHTYIWRSTKVSEVVRWPDWVTLSGNLTVGTHVISSGRLKGFGCYFYGLGTLHSYMQTGGYLDTLTDVSCNETLMDIGDSIDNDCDGHVDEEQINAIDDDGDGIIDEDVEKTRRTSLRGTVTGLVFILGVPVLKNVSGETFLYMYTFSETELLVNVSFPKNKNLHAVIDHVTVHPFQVTKFAIHPVYNTVASPGKMPCIKLFSDTDFGAYMFLYDYGDSVASLQLLPLSAWGTKYNLVATRFMPFLEIINGYLENNITISVPKHVDASLAHLKKFINKVIILGREEMLILSTCSLPEKDHKTLTGVSVTGTTFFAIISGGCHNQANTSKCGSQDVNLGNTRDLSLEMLPPVDLYGTEFIRIFLVERLTPSDLIVFASQHGTVITEHSTQLLTYKLNANEWAYLKESTVFDPVYITSNRPVLAVLLMRSTCHTDTNKIFTGELSDLAMSILLPSDLFYYAYIWRTPEHDILKFKHFVALVTLIKYKSLITVDRKLAIWSLRRYYVLGNSDWVVLTGSISEGFHDFRSDRLKTFGCYFYGLGQHFAYMVPGAYLDTLSDVSCKESNSSVDDDIDNDCDGKVNEESLNFKDDDSDGLIDEDIAKPHHRNGFFNEWSDWQCTRNCSESRAFRLRHCNRPVKEFYGTPCSGISIDYKNSSCYYDTVCPEECPHGTYGHLCLGRCTHCYPDCDKFNGSCLSCIAGWKDEIRGCSRECDFGTYGYKCNYSCFEKCESDCLERVTGQCVERGSVRDLIFLLIIVFVSPLCCMQCCIIRSEHQFDEDALQSFEQVSSVIL